MDKYRYVQGIEHGKCWIIDGLEITMLLGSREIYKFFSFNLYFAIDLFQYSLLFRKQYIRSVNVSFDLSSRLKWFIKYAVNAWKNMKNRYPGVLFKNYNFFLLIARSLYWYRAMNKSLPLNYIQTTNQIKRTKNH